MEKKTIVRFLSGFEITVYLKDPTQEKVEEMFCRAYGEITTVNVIH